MLREQWGTANFEPKEIFLFRRPPQLAGRIAKLGEARPLREGDLLPNEKARGCRRASSCPAGYAS
jgi:hypothetical protein